jgi:hypothetical protein
LGHQELHLIRTSIHGSLTNVYGPQIPSQKIKLLEFLESYKQDLPRKMWILGGDFNLITSLHEKKGGRRTLTQEDNRFKDFIDSFEMVDMETSNGLHT